MKISEMSNEAALDACAEIIEPMAEILADKEVANAARSGQAVKAIKPAIKNHKASIIKILAALDGVDPEDYKVSVLTLPKKVMELINDPGVKDLFSLQPQKTVSDVSGAAGESIGESEN